MGCKLLSNLELNNYKISTRIKGICGSTKNNPQDELAIGVLFAGPSSIEVFSLWSEEKSEIRVKMTNYYL